MDTQAERERKRERKNKKKDNSGIDLYGEPAIMQRKRYETAI